MATEARRPIVSAVVLTWNSAKYLRLALESLSRELEALGGDLIVVDNGSTDNSLELVRAVFPSVTIVSNGFNRGVAPARNQGMRIARGRYVLLLDSDTEMMPGSLRRMLEFMEALPEVGVVGPRLVYPDGIIQYSCRKFPTAIGKILRQLPTSIKRHLRSVADEELQHLSREHPSAVDYVIGACQLIRSETIQEVGLLDEDIFYGPEDVDYCLRAWRAGWSVYYLPDAVVIHHEQRVWRKKPGRLVWLHAKGLAHYFWKHRYLLRRPRVRPH